MADFHRITHSFPSQPSPGSSSTQSQELNATEIAFDALAVAWECRGAVLKARLEELADWMREGGRRG